MKSVEMRDVIGKLLILLVLIVAFGTVSWAGQWTVLGPDGGDVRSLAYDPHNPNRVLLGTSTGVIFESENAGHDWVRFAHLGAADDYVLDHIAFDPQNSKTIFVSAWSVQDQSAGDIFRTRNGGKDWEAIPGMRGKSVRAMAIAASDSKILVAGALDGVYRSNDGGNHWERISPANDASIKNVESIAINPQDPGVVYAGTWHLAWKTSDGGVSWQHINKGMIDDSDVFSIIVSSASPSEVFASACSGIYKSINAGDLFQKIQGIPFSARRTRVLKQDPSNPAIVYAGTTEGLWKSSDEGKSWKRVGNPEIVVNDVLIDPRNSQRILLATDRGGVLASDDGAATFSASNHGYTHRYARGGAAWHPINNIVIENASVRAIKLKNGKSKSRVSTTGVRSVLGARVNDVELGAHRWFAATSAGLFSSKDQGKIWTGGPIANQQDFVSVQSQGELVVAATRSTVLVSHNEGVTWQPVVLASYPTNIRSVTVTPDTQIFVASREGAFRSADSGKSWSHVLAGLPDKDITSVAYDGFHKRFLAASGASGVVFESADGSTWRRGPDSGFPLRHITVAHGRYVAATPFDGVIAQPQSESQSAAALNSGASN